MHVLLRLLINAAALWVATRLVSGISYTGDGVALFGVALVFGVLNVLIKPVLFVLNAVMLLITSAASDALGLGFHVDGFGTAFLGGLVVSIVSFALSLLVPSDDQGKQSLER